MSTSNNDALLAQMRERFLLAQEALTEIHREALEDFKFRAGGDDQWDPRMLRKRKDEGRPVITINRIPQFIRQVAGEQRKNRPAIQVSPIGDGADVELADIMQGLVRHVERTGDAEEAYDSGFDSMLTGGFGYIRLVTEYESEDDEDNNNQEIKFRREANPFAHYPDPRSKKRDHSDARYWFVIEDISREEFEEQYPDSSLVGLNDFAGIADRAPGWLQKDSVRVAEYFWVERKRRKGKKRDVYDTIVHWVKTNGVEILEEAVIPGRFIPIVPVLGEELLVDGKRYLIGLVRHARTPQQLYNLQQSALAEAIAMAPKAPYTATPAQVEGFEEIWEDANNSNYSYLPYNPDPKAPGSPQRQFAEPAVQAINGAIQQAEHDLQATTGLYDPSLGAPSSDQSGKAILLRQKQGSNANFAFVDAMTVAMKHLGRIILDWIPTYYDAARIVRIVNPDGTSDTVPVNQHFVEDGLVKFHDLSMGKYDVSISTGPSYDSQREEAAQSIMALVQSNPQLMGVVGDLLVKCFDWPMAEEISERLKKMLPPALQENGGQQQVPPEAQAKLSQLMQQNSQMAALLQQLKQEREAETLKLASQEKIAAWKTQADLVMAIAKVRSADAQQMADLEYQRLSQLMEQGHEVGMLAAQQAHGRVNQSMSQPQPAEQAASQPQADPAPPQAGQQPVHAAPPGVAA